MDTNELMVVEENAKNYKEKKSRRRKRIIVGVIMLFASGYFISSAKERNRSLYPGV